MSVLLPGLYGIPVELLKTHSENTFYDIHNFFTENWTGTIILQDWVNGILVTLYNGKQKCSPLQLL